MHRRTFSVFFFAVSSSIALAASPVQERADHFLQLANARVSGAISCQRGSAMDGRHRRNTRARRGGGSDRQSFTLPSMAMGRLYGNARSAHAQKELTPITIRQLKQLLLYTAEGPMTNPDLVTKRVEAETKQASILNSFEFKLNGQKITANDIDNKLEKSNDLAERKAVWEASKESGPALKPNTSSCAIFATAWPGR